MTPKYRLWADETSLMFGGLDSLTVDAIYDSRKGLEYIMEVNGTASGLAPACEVEDHLHIRDLVVERMNAVLCLAFTETPSTADNSK